MAATTETSTDAPRAADPVRGRRRHPVRWGVITLGVAVVVPMLAVLGARMGKDTTIVSSPLLGRATPAFDLPRFDQPGRMRSADLTGRIYVINYWASWCVPCRQETPVLDNFYQRWQPRGVELVGILYGDTVKAALTFRRELGGTWPLADDRSGRVALDYGVRGVPETFVIDARGVVMAKLIGAVGPGVLDRVIEQIKSGSGPVSSKNDQYRTAPDG